MSLIVDEHALKHSPIPRIETYESQNAHESRRWSGHFFKDGAALPVRFYARNEESLLASMHEFWGKHAPKHKPTPPPSPPTDKTTENQTQKAAHPFANTTWISKAGENARRIPKGELATFLDQGWTHGKSRPKTSA